ncbi:MAG: DUF4157 domain-containing protein [Candidatus Aminicenantes bacterium]|nr:DUF4157 domain-containing protein [Candidatus Aminicenantes bacterium]NIM81069.1 DUF4157 domain-containing protein [Candidatus Aminicenantes bacterium]NIN20446.1 DUF4157 domain-containing protein [Candidatus Aminicenantes bacterium]NIN44219.1 DUF4157 domain-containing protein [Candidatus Aminicenantes bacterium]NIN87037.1 DUF4157 domain-containing protein [Candidatus Aminicenantes bacterium]
MNESTRQYAKKNETKRENLVSRKQRDEASQTLQSPVEQVLHLQKTIGNQAVTQLIQSGAIQAKLKIGQPDDMYEQEADRVAEQVMRMEEGSLVNGHSSLVQRESTCPECMEEAEQVTPLVQRETMDVDENEDELKPKLMDNHLLQRQEAIPDDEDDETTLLTKAVPGSTPEVTSDIESRINSMKGGGQPLSEASRAFFEPRFGTDFSGVRIHTDPRAAQTAQSINAKAFTTGKDIVFNSGQYSPATSSGKRLLAHELTHVVQKEKHPDSYIESSSLKPFLQRQPQAPGPSNIRRNNEYQMRTILIRYSRRAYIPVEGVAWHGSFSIFGTAAIKRSRNNSLWKLDVGMVLRSAASRFGNLVASGWVRLVADGRSGQRVPLVHPRQSIHALGDVPLSARNAIILPRTGTIELDIFVSTMLESPGGRTPAIMSLSPERIKIFPA